MPTPPVAHTSLPYPGTRLCASGFVEGYGRRSLFRAGAGPLWGTWLLLGGRFAGSPIFHVGWCGTPLGHLAIAHNPADHTSLLNPSTRQCSNGAVWLRQVALSLGWFGVPLEHLAIAQGGGAVSSDCTVLGVRWGPLGSWPCPHPGRSHVPAEPWHTSLFGQVLRGSGRLLPLGWCGVLWTPGHCSRWVAVSPTK